MRGERVPLVLLPGSLADPDQWHCVARLLTDVSEPICLTFGDGDNVHAMAKAVLAAVAVDTFALAGFSLGGYVALEVVRLAPERVSHLILLDTTARPDAAQTRQRRLVNIEAFAHDPVPLLEGFAQLTLGPDTPPDLVEAIKLSMHRNGPAQYVAQQRAMLSRPDARLHLADIQCPALVICGAHDRATTPALNREIAEGIPGGRYLELCGAGHMILLERPDAVAGALKEFLQSSLVAARIGCAR